MHPPPQLVETRANALFVCFFLPLTPYWICCVYRPCCIALCCEIISIARFGPEHGQHRKSESPQFPRKQGVTRRGVLTSVQHGEALYCGGLIAQPLTPYISVMSVFAVALCSAIKIGQRRLLLAVLRALSKTMHQGTHLCLTVGSVALRAGNIIIFLPSAMSITRPRPHRRNAVLCLPGVPEYLPFAREFIRMSQFCRSTYGTKKLLT